MTLDEIEKDAAHVVKHWAGMPSHATAERLARALLLVMPVVRAGERYRRCPSTPNCGDLFEAIDTMRRGLGEG